MQLTNLTSCQPSSRTENWRRGGSPRGGLRRRGREPASLVRAGEQRPRIHKSRRRRRGVRLDVPPALLRALRELEWEARLPRDGRHGRRGAHRLDEPREIDQQTARGETACPERRALLTCGVQAGCARILGTSGLMREGLRARRRQRSRRSRARATTSRSGSGIAIIGSAC